MEKEVETKKEEVPKKEKMKEYMRKYGEKYYAENKNKILSYCKEKIQCDICGAIISRRAKSQHIKSKKHLKAKEERDKGIKNKKIPIECCERKIKKV